MSKLNRDQARKKGEELLHEWNVAGDETSVATLRAALGRDATADLAIAARLGAVADVASIEALQALDAASDDKLVHKEVKRALYRLEQRGVDIPRPREEAPKIAPAEAAVEGYLSSIDRNGDQVVWLTRSRGGALLHIFAVINDPAGLQEFELFETTRKQLRGLRDEILSQHGARMIPTDWRYCDFLIDRAFHWAREHGVSAGDYPRARTNFTNDPPQSCEPIIRSLLDADEVAADSDALESSKMLLAEPELQMWLLSYEVMQPYVEEWADIVDSPLVLSDAQKAERIDDLSKKAISEIFGGDQQASWVRRIQELAYTFHATGRTDQARSALAAAIALEKSDATGDAGGVAVPLLQTLTDVCLRAHLQAHVEAVEEEKKSSLIASPADVAREAEQRRRRP